MFRRAVAFIIDGIVFSCALGIFSELTGWADVDTGVRSTASGEYFFDFGVDFRFDSIGDMLLAAVVFVLCKSVREALFQKTLGKRVTGLLVVSDSGGDRVSWNQASYATCSSFRAGRCSSCHRLSRCC